MKKLLFNLINVCCWIISFFAVMIFMGDINDDRLVEGLLWKGAALLWFVLCYKVDGRKPKNKQFFDHNVRLF